MEFLKPTWGMCIGYLLVTTHITIVSITIFLHRCQTHRALNLHPAVSHFFRFWLWLTTGMVTREWVAVHRYHHANTDKSEDPHSPVKYGIWKVLFGGVFLYRKAAKKAVAWDRGAPTPRDGIEKHLYSRHIYSGVITYAVLDVLLLGVSGVFIWLIQMAWVPFFAAGVINGVGHHWGYRNFKKLIDSSRNIIPLGILIGGEELHNNHHKNPRAAKFSVNPWEFDIGWLYIRILVFLRLAKVKHSNVL